MNDLPEPIIREATAEDAYAIAEIGIDAWRIRYIDIFPAEYLSSLSVEDKANRIRNTIENPDFKVIVLEQNRKVIGFCIFGKHEEGENRGQIYAIYLHPTFWRNGYGTILIRSAIDVLVVNKYSQIVVWSLARNAKSNLFYEKIGFQKSNSSKPFAVNSEELLIEYVMRIGM